MNGDKRMNSVRILITMSDNQYGVIDRFAKELKAGFEKIGCEVDLLDCRKIDSRNQKKILARNKNQKYDFIIDFNLWSVHSIEKYVKDSATIFWGFLIDSPMYHLERLLPCNRNVIVSFVDRRHLIYAERELKSLSYITFMPHGGSRAEKIMPYRKRKCQVVFFGSYMEIADKEAQLNNENESLQYLLGKVIEQLYGGEAEFIELMEKELNFEGNKYTEYQRKYILYYFAYIIALVRNVKRMHLLEILGAGGIPVEVYGNGWDQYVNKYPEYIHICGPVTYDESLEIMGDAKIVVNNMPLFADGSHERIFTAMRCGAVVFSEENAYLREEFEENKEIVFFSYKNLELVPEKIKLLLNHETAAEYIADSGRVKAETFHTWDNRAEHILEILLELKEQQKAWGNVAIPIYSDCDEAFNRLLFQVNGVDEDMLYEKMKGISLGKALSNPAFQLRQEQSFRNYPYWGKLDVRQDEFEVCRQRAGQLKNRMEKYIWLYGRLGDETSRKILLVLLQHWLYDASLDEMPRQHWEQYFDMDLICFQEGEVFVDCGAYQGETLIDFMLACKCCKKAYCYEFDEKNLVQLRENVSGYPNVVVRPCAVGDEEKEIFVLEAEDSSSSRLESTGNGRKVPMVTLDSDIVEEITFLKADIEGAEKLMLRGSERHIRQEKPKLAIAVYHGNSDILDIPLLIEEMNPDYKFYLRYYGGNLYPNEIVLYAI